MYLALIESNEVVGSSENACDALWNELKQHPIFTNPYFNFLQHAKWNKNTYELHRANFFYRTELTVKAIAHVCSRAAAQDDQDTLVLYAHILNEECGNGSLQECHAVLMERAHNLFGEAEFGLDPLLLKDARKHPLIIKETLQYREKLQELVSGNYKCMLGCVMFMEMHAEKMLLACRQAFRSSREHLKQAQYRNQVEKYFNCHLDNGVEERHAQDSRQCVSKNCDNMHDLAEIRYGAEEAAKAQLSMWNALYGAVVESQVV